jgi:hypothetical protein
MKFHEKMYNTYAYAWTYTDKKKSTIIYQVVPGPHRRQGFEHF